MAKERLDNLLLPLKMGYTSQMTPPTLALVSNALEDGHMKEDFDLFREALQEEMASVSLSLW